MALVSPGVEVTIIDQSQYLPAASNSVPLILLATAQNKANASGTGVATATTAANANKLYQVTSQRDLVNLYGTPFFYKTTNGTSIQGYELNEYGLLAAYSLLGVTNRCFVLRADIDLASLVGQVGRPKGNPNDGTYWLDTTNSTWGIYEFNASTGKFTGKTPIVITDSTYISANKPVDTLGNIGDYAINAIPIVTGSLAAAEYFYKNTNNTWVGLGSTDWINSWPTVSGTIANPGLTANDVFTITVNGTGPTDANRSYNIELTVPAAPNDNISGIVNQLNNLGLPYLTAAVVDSKISFYSSQLGTNQFITLSEDGGTTVLEDMGITPGTYYQPMVSSGTSAEMPLWTSSQSQPHPTGSVWIKTSSAGIGAQLVISRFNTASSAYITQNCPLYVAPAGSSAAAINAYDTTGGQAIPAESLFATYPYVSSLVNQTAPVYIRKRFISGPTVITGSNNDPTFGSEAAFNVYVTVPGSSALSSAYTVTLPVGSSGASEFVASWTAANIPYTSATVTVDGNIQLTHLLGGDIILDDTSNGMLVGTIAEAGFIADSTDGVTLAGPASYQNPSAEEASSTSTFGSGSIFNITAYGPTYIINGITDGGTQYEVGDIITISGETLGGATPANDMELYVAEIGGGGAITKIAYVSGTPSKGYNTLLTNFRPLTYTANEGAPAVDPANNTNWFYSVTDEVDIMVNKNGNWVAYRNTAYDTSGHPAATGSNTTDPLGPIISASEPTTQQDGTTALSYGDIWIDTSDLENYPVIYRWQDVDGVDQWVLIDNTDQTSQNGVLFADARWAGNGTTDPIDDPFPSIVSLLTNNYLDLDAPEATNYPQGMLLFNTRRSGYNVKQFRTNYFNGTSFPDQTLPSVKNTWVSVSGLRTNGSPYMGRKAQRNMVVQAITASINTNLSIREEDTFFNLMAAPNYPELQPQMVSLNNERANTAYILGDTPLRLPDQATDITNWATNAAGASATGEDGLVTRDEYMGLFYPSGITTDLTGASVVVPSSHMMLRTFLRNDTIAYPWLAAAGTRRGTIDNATNIGYLDATTGEFQVIKNRMGIRDVLYINQINPLAFFTGVGLLNYGNKSSKDTQSALDRTNVARLIAYIRERLQVLARPFVFEPNDAITRSQLTAVVQTLFIDLVAKRGLYDYSVVCDASNNTPARIDRNELWVDVAVEPVKAAEFIYIPVRIYNTGEIAALQS
jgi:hypothetical protein